MTMKWKEIRPDKHLTPTALATKGKRLYDRAHKDIKPKNAWLGKNDLDEITIKVNKSLDESCNAPDESLGNCTTEKENEATVTSAQDTAPCSENDPEFNALSQRCHYLFDTLKRVHIMDQKRRPLKKKCLSFKRQKYANKISESLLGNLDPNERETIDLINTAIYCVAAVFTYKAGQELMHDNPTGHDGKKKADHVPAWKKRLSRKISCLRMEADLLNEYVECKIRKSNSLAKVQKIMKKYGIDSNKNDVKTIIFILKNKITALATKLRRYNVQEKSKRQNDLFGKNRKQFYREIETETKFDIPSPPSEAELKQFWGENIFGQSDLYDPNADWIPDWRNQYTGLQEQEWTNLNMHDVSHQLNKQLNWKAPGIDRVPNYWLKALSSTHNALSSAMNECILLPHTIPQWLVTGRTTLLPKNADTSKAKNFRPITCLTTFWKTMTGILATRIERHLQANNLLATEQQGARRGSYGTKQQLIINKTILEHAIKARRNLSVTYIDYQKAYDSVPHPWIIETLRTYRISEVIIVFLEHAMKMWEITLVLNHENGTLEVPKIKIKRGIFQGDTLSPLLFVIAINPISYLLNKHGKGYKMENTICSQML